MKHEQFIALHGGSRECGASLLHLDEANHLAATGERPNDDVTDRFSAYEKALAGKPKILPKVLAGQAAARKATQREQAEAAREAAAAKRMAKLDAITKAAAESAERDADAKRGWWRSLSDEARTQIAMEQRGYKPPRMLARPIRVVNGGGPGSGRRA
jgi:hypothetical protein